MAFVSDGFSLSVSLIASNAGKMNARYELTATTYADAVTDTGAILAALDGVSAGTVIGYTITSRSVEDAFTTVPTSDDAEYGEKCTVTGQIKDNPLKTAKFVIPMPKIAIFLATLGENRDNVDLSDTALLAYAELFDAGGEAYLSDGESLDYLLRGKRNN